MTKQTLNFWIDAHVHIYSIFNIDHLLDDAFRNFTVASETAPEDQNEFVLFVTEGINEHAIDNLQAYANSNTGHWTLNFQTDHIIATTNQGERLFLILGQQLVSSEGIELMLIGGEHKAFSPRLPIRKLLSALSHALPNTPPNEIAILPWGFGKWLGMRGQHISELITDKSLKCPLFLGDIPARLNVLGGKTQFISAAEHNKPILGGTDPLPLEEEHAGIGAFGTCLILPAQYAEELPIIERLFKSLRALHGNKEGITSQPFGKKLTLFKNLSTQIQLRLKK